LDFNPNRVIQGDVEPTKTWERKGTKWLGKPDKFLNELPKEVVFPLYEGTETVTLIDDNPHATLWYITYRNGVFARIEVVIRRKFSHAFGGTARALGYNNRVWICSEPAGVASPSVTALRAFQNIGFDVYETL